MAIYQIEWKKSAIRELRRIDRTFVAKIIEAVAALSDQPLPAGVVKLQGSQRTY